MYGNENITMQAYAPGGGYYADQIGAAGPLADLDTFAQVHKAISATGELPRTGPGINALGVEEVQGTLASAEYREKMIKAWKRIPKSAAKSLIPEFARLDDLGDDGARGFMGPTDAGFVTDPRFHRGSNIIRYMGAIGYVDLPTQMIEAIGFGGKGVNVMNTARTLKMMELLRNIERNLFYGAFRLDGVSWNGFIEQIDSAADEDNSIRLDLQGAALDRYVLSYISQIAANNNADLSDVYVPNEGLLDLQQSLFPNVRTGDNIPDAAVGINFKRLLVESIGGDPEYVDIVRQQFLTRGVKGGLPRRVTSRAARNAPSRASSVTGAAGAWTATNYQPGLRAGTYYYDVQAFGAGGRTLPTTITAAVTCTAGQAITLSITCDDETVQGFEIFRNKAGESGAIQKNRYYMDQVARTGFITTYVDNGYAIPDTYDVVALDYNADEIYFKQLMPILSRVLPPDLMGNRFALLCFGTPVFEVPTHNLHLANCGRRIQAGVASLQQ